MDIFGKIHPNRSAMPEVDLSQGRSIAYLHSTTTRLMDVLDANGRGNVHGGVIMRVVDESAAIVAIKHARRPVVNGCRQGFVSSILGRYRQISSAALARIIIA
jgi:acyl-coenzyme A thioesterase PaaI-like protein